jgi:hypothetical protein
MQDAWLPPGLCRDFSRQFGCTSAPAVPQFAHTIRDPNKGTRICPGNPSALMILPWRHWPQDGTRERMPDNRMSPIVLGAVSPSGRSDAISNHRTRKTFRQINFWIFRGSPPFALHWYVFGNNSQPLALAPSAAPLSFAVVVDTYSGHIGDTALFHTLKPTDRGAFSMRERHRRLSKILIGYATAMAVRVLRCRLSQE